MFIFISPVLLGSVGRFYKLIQCEKYKFLAKNCIVPIKNVYISCIGNTGEFFNKLIIKIDDKCCKMAACITC